MSRIAVLAITAALLILAPQALAKEITGAKVCGASDCRDVEAPGLLLALPDTGDPTDPPRNPGGGWYRTTVTMDAEGHRESFAVDAFPRQNLVRVRDDTTATYRWLPMTSDAARAYRKITFGLDPRPISRLTGFEARPPAAAPDPAPGGGFPWAWVAAAVSFGAAAAAFAMRRHRGGRFGHPGAATAD
jgi:hypothetical protein